MGRAVAQSGAGQGWLARAVEKMAEKWAIAKWVG